MTELPAVRRTEAEQVAEGIFQTMAPGPEIKWGHCSVCDATLTRVAGLISAHDAALVERTRQEVFYGCLTALWERIGNEEYGHAKAAVALDIEAIEEYQRAIRALAEETEDGRK